MKCSPLHIRKNTFSQIHLCNVMGVPVCNQVLQLLADYTNIFLGNSFNLCNDLRYTKKLSGELIL